VTQPGPWPEDRLAIVLFGPGFGESVAVRSPDGRWLVVDSLRDPVRERNPALATMIDDEGQPELLILSHPHEDHANGFPQLIERQTAGRVGAVARPPAAGRDPLRDPDAGAALRRGRARLALAAIQARWEAAPSSRWPLVAGEQATLGPLSVEVLAPREALVSTPPSNVNAMSVAVRIRWEETVVLLGGDLTTLEWGRVDGRIHLGAHALFKVAHHGSRRSQHNRLSDPVNSQRVWLLAPWTLAGHHLPRLEDDRDLGRLLRRVGTVELTSSPVTLRGEASRPIARTELLRLVERSTFGGSDLVLEYDDEPRSSETAWTAALLTRDGDVEEIRRGSAALSVTQ